MSRHSDKLKNENKSREYYGQKLRGEGEEKKASIEEIKSGKRKAAQAKAQSRERSKEIVTEEKKAAKKRSASGQEGKALITDVAADIVAARDGDNNTDVAEDVFRLAADTGKTAAGKIKSIIRTNKYSGKLHEKKDSMNQDSSRGRNESGSKSQQKHYQKKEYQREHQKKKQKENAQKAAEKVKELGKEAAEFIADFIESHPEAAIAIVIILILFLVISGMLSSCSMTGTVSENIVIATTYTAEDEDIIGAEQDYKDLEEELQDDIDDIESDYEGYDEYVYTLDEIGHNPYQLAAILTVLYEDYTREEVQAMLQEIYELQYELTTEEVVETREREVEKTGTRWVEDDSYEDGGYEEEYTYTDTEEYDYYILYVTLTNHTLEEVVTELGFTEDQMERYELLVYTYGNKKYLFEGDIYSVPEPGEYEGYNVPSEYLTDEEFARMYAELDRYIGMEYVWGGSNPSTGFDCSGYVCWVINHCGNGWNVGRQSANGLKHITASVPESDVHAGDLIFFQGTYATSGASHVGIVVDPVNHIMAHAGNPIKYSSYDTSYWHSHAYGYGRLP